MLGHLADSERFFASRPESFESFVDQVREFANNVADARASGEVDEETCGIVIVDSIRKLVPEKIMEKILKEGASGKDGSVDGMGGRAAQIRAAMNAAWMDELVPLLDRTRIAAVLVARESEDPNADVWAKKYGNDYKIGGGRAIYYDSSLVVRIDQAGYVEEDRGGKKPVTIGERVRATIRKTKVAGKEDKVVTSYFHTSNGVDFPIGFDPARDLVELGLKLGVVEQNGSWCSWRGEKWNSRANLMKALREADGELETLEADCRAKFADVEPESPAEGE
jgi:RecA/RadA recombinase